MFNEYPYVNIQDVNLDWILKHIKDLETNLQDFIKLNTVKYADPIDWDISRQYEANTVVVDPFTGVAYLSTQPVPTGVNITNTDYWTPIFTLDFVNMNKNITIRNDGNNNIATFPSDVGDWLIVGGQLYKVTQYIPVGNNYIVGTNIDTYSVELFIKDYVTNILNITGDLNDLNTSDKTSIVNAINSVLTDIDATIGDLNDLNTSDKTSIVNAINSVLTDIATVIGDLNDLNTSDKTSVVNAINEVNDKIIWHSPKEYGAIGDGVNDDTTAVQACINDNDYVFIDGNFYVTDIINLHNDLYMKGKGTFYNPLVKTTLKGENISNIILEDFGFINGARDGSHPDLNANIYIHYGEDITIRGIYDNLLNKPSTIMLDHCERFDISDCILSKSGYCGIMLHGNCHYGNIHDNVVEVDNYTGYTNTYGIAVSFTPDDGSSITDRTNECTYINIDNNNVYTAYSWWEGIDTHAGQYINIRNNTISGFWTGISLTYGNYSSLAVASKYCQVTGNEISADGVSLDAARTARVGIGVYGNAVSGECNNVISNNYIHEIDANIGGVDDGIGIFARGYGMEVSENNIQRHVTQGIRIDNLGRAIISGNNFVGTGYDACIVYNGSIDRIGIFNNTATRYRNFYNLLSNTGLNNIFRRGNNICSGYWMNDQFAVTDVSIFVPDYCKGSPTSSAYHPNGQIALQADPAVGVPAGWISTGSTWVSMANLT